MFKITGFKYSAVRCLTTYCAFFIGVQMSTFNYSSADVAAAEADLVDQITEGVQEAEIEGRRIKLMDPLRRIEAINQLAADVDSDTYGAFMKPKFCEPE